MTRIIQGKIYVITAVEFLSNNFPNFEISHRENKFIEFNKQGVLKFFLRKDADSYALRVPCTVGGDSYRKSDTLSLRLFQKDIEKLKKIIEELSL